MAEKLYELRIYRAAREIREVPAYLAALDLQDLDAVKLRLGLHLLGAADTIELPRAQVHLLHLEARATDREGRAFGRPVFRWKLPVDPEVAQWP